MLGDPYDLAGGPPVTAMIVQNTNPASVAPDQTKVKQGLAREDLFVCVHEQFMTETAQLADIVLPATMFLEHDDIYQGGGHQHIMLGRKLVEPPGECRNNHEVICDLARRVGAEASRFRDDAERDHRLRRSRHRSRPDLARLEDDNWIDVQPEFETAHFLNGFGHPDGKYHFKPDWKTVRFRLGLGPFGPVDDMPELPDHWGVIEEATDEIPFRLATSPARTFLNSTFNETPSSRKREGRPTVFVHPDDLAALGHRRRRQGFIRQQSRNCDAPCQGLRRCQAWRSYRRSDLAERGFRGRAGNQYVDRVRSARPVRRRRLPRQSRVDQARQMNGR